MGEEWQKLHQLRCSICIKRKRPRLPHHRVLRRHQDRGRVRVPSRRHGRGRRILVNQEDVEMAMASNGDLAANFDCRFYADNDRKDQIMSHNIVNMGEMLYGVVDADELHGLGFKLTAVEVSDPQNAANVYDVTANAATVNYS